MVQVPIYPQPPQAAVEGVQGVALDRACTLCPLHQGARTVCMPAELVLPRNDDGGAEYETLLVVGMYPGREDDASGRTNVSASGRYIRNRLAEQWPGRVVFDNAVKCAPGGAKLSGKHYNACRPYLRQVIDQAKPSRILMLGGAAVMGVLGRAVPVQSARRGYAWMHGLGVPAFMLAHPARLMSNRFLRARWERDLGWALSASGDIKASRAYLLHTLGQARVVYTDYDIAVARAELEQAEWFAFDVETYGRIHTPEFRLLSVACVGKGAHHSWVWDEDSLATPAAAVLLQQLMTNPNVGKVAHNAKYDIMTVRQMLGVEPAPLHGDTLVWRKQLSADVMGRLSAASELVGLGGHKEEADKHLRAAKKRLKERDKEQGITRDDYGPYVYSDLPWDTLLRYNARDTVATAWLSEMLGPRVRKAFKGALWDTWEGILRPAIYALSHAEAWGVHVDVVKARQLGEALDMQTAALHKRLNAVAEINWAAPAQIAQVLYTQLGLPVNHRTDKGAPSTNKLALAKLAPQHEVVRDLLEWRRLSKLRSTYVDAFIRSVGPDGRIHPTYNLMGARSGRLSCERPNLQNIPATGTDEGKLIRDMFVAPEGRTLVEADFSQLELRVVAMLSGDEGMAEIYRSGEDYHLRTAKLIARQAWGISPDDVKDKPHRAAAKAVNFAILYGKTDTNLAEMIGCSVEDATKVRSAVFGAFPKLHAWVQARLAEVRQTGSTWTINPLTGRRGRRRPLWDVADPDRGRRGHAERASFNTPIQGTASDYCLLSVIELVRRIRSGELDAKLVLTVHDSVMLECAEGNVGGVVEQVREVMESWSSGDVPLVVDVKTGRAWGSLEEWGA